MEGRKAAASIFIFWLAFYLAQIVLVFFLNTPLPDMIVVFSVVLVMFLLHLRFNFSPFVALFTGLALLFHSIGFYYIVPYGDGQVAMLYGAPQLLYHYDWVVHGFGYLFAAIAACFLFYNRVLSGLRSHLFAAAFIILALVGIGALIEVAEFAGFQTIGYGEGFLLMGDGDFATKESVWDNASMDQLSNLIGALSGAIIYLAFFYSRKAAKNK